jgi:2-keto-4-pentenoate hydratase/2-oxohepta-3-ene-1,7-dioic acid hydratase in catechol pathway
MEIRIHNGVPVNSFPAIGSYLKPSTRQPALGLVIDGRIYDLSDARGAGIDLGEDRGWMPLLEDWQQRAPQVKAALEAAVKLVGQGKLKPVAGDVQILPPYRPERIFCAASNYIEHANEMGTVLAAKAESKPYMFLKLRNTVIGENDVIRKPPETAQLDWEIELAAVIGKPGRRISVDAALDHVAGYSIVNDISARDINVRSDYPFKFDWFQGKCHDTFAPFGPWIVPSWYIRDPQAVEMLLTVNGQEMQKDSTRNMIWTLREQISYLSTIVTLEPGDVVATGTPTGVGMGRGVYLNAGDKISATVDGIGTLNNTVAAES